MDKNKKEAPFGHKLRTFALPLLLFFLAAAMLLRPEESLAAVKESLQLWYSVIIPSLLPFFIISNLLVALGAAEAAGRALSPLMRPLFNLPGAASLALLMGFGAGFPTGAAVTAELRRKNLLSREQAGRLLAFTNNAGPLYLTVAVAAGLFNSPAAAGLLALSHYGLNLLLGLLLGVVARRKQRPKEAAAAQVLGNAAVAVPLGSALKDAAWRAASNIIIIGCYMAFFSLLADVLSALLPADAPLLLQVAASGIWEMSLGLAKLAQSGSSLPVLLPLAAAQLAFGGLSVQAQVLAMIADTDISPRIYLVSRLLHSAAAWLLMRLLLQNAAPVIAAPGAIPAPIGSQPELFSLFTALAIAAFCLILAKRQKQQL